MSKKQFSVFKLKLSAPLHVSSGGFGLEQADAGIRSDTLFGALCRTVGMLWGDDTVEGWIQEPPFRISSCFPYVDQTLFFPKPITMEIPKDLPPKSWKKVKYLSEDLFKAWIRGGQKALTPKTAQVQGIFYTEDLKLNSDLTFMKEDGVSRVTVDRVNQAGSIFNFAQYHLQKVERDKLQIETGLYFLVDWGTASEHDIQVFKSGLQLLADEGLGADRTVGKGWFMFDAGLQESITFEVPEAADAHFLLSLYHPSGEDLKLVTPEKSRYELITRKGWISGTDFKRQSVRFITEGSLMHMPNPPEGDSPVVYQEESDFRVVRYGHALSIPVHSNA